MSVRRWLRGLSALVIATQLLTLGAPAVAAQPALPMASGPAATGAERRVEAEPAPARGGTVERASGSSPAGLHAPSGQGCSGETLTYLFGEHHIQTTCSYTGTITVDLTGSGTVFGSGHSDAFYRYEDLNGNRITPLHPTADNSYVMWVNNESTPVSTYIDPIPGYDEGHSYSVTLTAPGGTLLFGMQDPWCCMGNTGTLTITINGGGLPVEPPPADTDRNQPDCASATCGKPVNTLTGSESYTVTDLEIPGRGGGVAFSRSYNSNDTRVGPLGIGWTHNYAVRLVAPGDQSGDIVLVGPLGRSDRYRRQGTSSAYLAPPGVTTTLERLSGGTYVATHRDQSKLTFNASGQLTKLADRYGNESTLSYNGSGQLTAIADPGGRGSLTLGYTSGRLTSVTDWLSPTPRVASFQYDGSNRLWKVTDRESQTTTYGYDGTSHRLTTITDPLGNVLVTNSYDTQGRVTEQRDARGIQTGGQPLSIAYGSSVDGTKAVTITHPATSYESSYQPQERHRYDAAGRLTERTFQPTSSAAEAQTARFGYDTALSLTGTQLTLALWVKPTSVTGTRTLLSQQDAYNDRGYVLTLVNGQPKLQLGDGGGGWPYASAAATTTTQRANSWQHDAVTRAGTTEQ
ncbi:MAG: hypothetical protein HY329_11160, partial [Chloroflexi bacterium]|nr:hypothetical protein [Chloroflexota bacterium]